MKRRYLYIVLGVALAAVMLAVCICIGLSRADKESEDSRQEASPSESHIPEDPTETQADVQTEPETQIQTSDVLCTEAPSTEAPSTEAPSTEAPSTEAPSTEAPSTEAPSTEAPSTEAPSTEAPSTEAPSTEAPSTEAPHVCESKCSTCGCCLDKSCTEKACEKKCGGHAPIIIHTCISKCDVCGSCVDFSCTEAVCASKCLGHTPVVEEHVCISKCSTCGCCLDKSCTEKACDKKCGGHAPIIIHTCISKCDICGSCVDSSCTEAVCASKCLGHTPIVEEHVCISKCDICGSCVDSSCVEAVCANKCLGHTPIVEEHVCISKCDICGSCVDSSCTEAVCASKCLGHTCSNLCTLCGLCADRSCTVSGCAGKCLGHASQVYSFTDGDFITTEEISIDTGKIVFDIGKNIYVPANIVELGRIMADTIESTSELYLEGNGYAQAKYEDGKIHIIVTRDILLAGQPWYTGLASSELGSARGSWYNFHVKIAPGDLFIGHTKTTVHELSHVLMWRQTIWNYGKALNEGFAEYTAFLTLREIELRYPEAAHYFDISCSSISEMSIYDYSKLYEHPIEYWFENTFEYSGNQDYAVGFRFMAYLHQVYGDYSGWITEFEKTYPYKSNTASNNATLAMVTEILKKYYGEDVLEGFYPWLKANESEFDPRNSKYTVNIDKTAADGVNLYPTFDAVRERAEMTDFDYNDLYINLMTARKYLSEYKGKDISGLYLKLSNTVKVELYGEDGRYSSVITDRISLEGVSYIKLVGRGSLDKLELLGFDADSVI